MHRVIKSNQEAFLKPYIDMNTEKKNGKKNEKDFCELVNNAVFGKTLENVRKHRDIKLVTAKERRNYLVLEPIYHTREKFSDILLAKKMKRTQILMNKPVYLVL